jgi:hypothetical protein
LAFGYMFAVAYVMAWLTYCIVRAVS